MKKEIWIRAKGPVALQLITFTRWGTGCLRLTAILHTVGIWIPGKFRIQLKRQMVGICMVHYKKIVRFWHGTILKRNYVQLVATMGGSGLNVRPRKEPFKYQTQIAVQFSNGWNGMSIWRTYLTVIFFHYEFRAGKFAWSKS